LTDFRLEAVIVPVSDVDRARDFYAERAGFTVDHDTRIGERRVVQLTPSGSACSIQIGTGLTPKKLAPGSVQGLLLVVSDMEAAYAELAGRGVELSEIEVLGRPGRPGLKFAYFKDPDGNGWTLQELPGSAT
jgi:catechol 2,3-dioxygenase-like lactoylglutathione lyase family enzyme